jgi:hypothetical protein
MDRNFESDADGVDDFARKNSISRSQIYEEIAAGRLIARKVGSRTIITREDGASWRRALPVFADAKGVAPNKRGKRGSTPPEAE